MGHYTKNTIFISTWELLWICCCLNQTVKEFRCGIISSTFILTSHLPAAFPSCPTRQPWEGYWSGDAGQMFSAMCPSLCVSYYSVHSEFTPVFNTACSCCSQLEWKYLGFCSIAPGEESCEWKCPNWAAKISTHGRYRPPQTGRDGVWRLTVRRRVYLREFADVLK